MDSVNKWIYMAIGLVVLLSVVAGVVPTINDSLGNLSATSGLPLASLFSRNGIVLLIIMAGILIAVVYGVMKQTKYAK